MGGPAEALFRGGGLPEGFWFGMVLLDFMFIIAVVMHGIIRFGRWERRNRQNDICYKV